VELVAQQYFFAFVSVDGHSCSAVVEVGSDPVQHVAGYSIYLQLHEEASPNSKSAKDHQRAQGKKRGGPQSADNRIADMCKRDFSNPQAVQGRLTII
jgi:hypothetical protein